jgi:hypothetical protein
MLNPDGMMSLVVTQIYIGNIYIYILGRTPSHIGWTTSDDIGKMERSQLIRREREKAT